MPIVNPSLAARLAAEIYDVKNELSKAKFYRDYQEILDVPQSSFSNPFQKKKSAQAFEGQTGALVVFKKTYVMGVVCKGKGIYENEAFLMIQAHRICSMCSLI